MMLLVDANEKATNSKVFKSLQAEFGKESVQISQLIAGDIAIPLETGLLLIERKKPHDLLASISDNRLFDQAQRMVEQGRFALTLVTGSIVYNNDDRVVADGQLTNWRGSSVRGALRAIQWAGCAVEYCTAAEYPQKVREAARVASRTDHYKIDRERTKPPPISFYPDDRERWAATEFLTGIPGVGRKRAEALIDWVSPRINGEPQWNNRLCDAISWITVIPWLVKRKEDRPDGWGDKTCKAFCDFLGLHDFEVLEVRRYSNGKETANGSA